MPLDRVRGQLFDALVDHADGLAGAFVCSEPKPVAQRAGGDSGKKP